MDLVAAGKPEWSHNIQASRKADPPQVDRLCIQILI